MDLCQSRPDRRRTARPTRRNRQSKTAMSRTGAAFRRASPIVAPRRAAPHRCRNVDPAEGPARPRRGKQAGDVPRLRADVAARLAVPRPTPSGLVHRTSRPGVVRGADATGSGARGVGGARGDRRQASVSAGQRSGGHVRSRRRVIRVSLGQRLIAARQCFARGYAAQVCLRHWDRLVEAQEGGQGECTAPRHRSTPPPPHFCAPPLSRRHPKGVPNV